jgi:hypothetical protein
MLRNPDTTVAASGYWFRILVLAIGSLLVAWSATREVDLERQLEAAIHREVVLGDLTGAMKEYRNILAQAEVPRGVAARALLQTGECMEKLGRGPEAYNSFRRIETEYGDQAALVELARTRLAAWVGPRNLHFEEGLPGRVPPFPWTVQAAPKEAGNVAELRREGCRSRTGCAVVTAPVNIPGQAGNLMQSFSAAAYRGKTEHGRPAGTCSGMEPGRNHRADRRGRAFHLFRSDVLRRRACVDRRYFVRSNR